MRLTLYLAGIQACATGMVALLSRWHGRRLDRNAFSPYWCWFWGAACLFHLTAAFHYLTDSGAGFLPAAAGAAACAGPGFLFLAGWAGRGRRVGQGARWAAIAIAAAPAALWIGSYGIPPWGGSPGLAAAVLLTSAGLAWTASAWPRRRPAERLLWIFTIGNAIVLAWRGLALLGLPVLGMGPEQAAALDAGLVLGILGSVLALMFQAVAMGHQRFSSVWRASSAGMRLCDLEGRILMVNPAFCRLVAKSEEDLLGRPLWECYSEETSERIAAGLRQRLASGEPPPVLEREMRLANGSKVWLELHNSLVDGTDGRLLLSVANDITERKTAEAAVARREQQLEILSRAGLKINAVLDEKSVMEAALAAAVELTGAGGGGYGTVQGGERCCAAPGARLCRAVATQPEPYVSNDAAAVAADSPPCLAGATAWNVACIPVMSRGGKLLACFEVHDTPRDRPLDGQDVLMLRSLASSAAVALENSLILAERRRAEEGLARSEHRYRSVVEGSPMGMHFYTLESDGRLIFQGGNGAAHQILGLDHTPLIGMEMEQAFPSHAASEIPARYREVVLTGRPWHSEQVDYRDNRVAGSYEVNAFQTGAGELTVMFQEITERKRAEEALRASEERYRLITDSSTDLISTHTPEGAFTFASPASVGMLGCEPGELLGRNLYERIHPEDVAAVRASHERAAGGANDRAAFRIRHQDGRWIWVEATSRVLRQSGPGEAGGIVAVTRDISDRRALEDQVRQSQKLESVGRLAGGVAHDFNNLLTVINGYAAMLRGDLDEGDPTREAVDEIAAAGARAAALTQQLLAFSRKQVMRPREIDLNETIRQAERMLRLTIREDIALELVLGEAGAVRADPGQVQQVLLNLAVNARDAMPNGGRLTIETCNLEVDSAFVEKRPEIAPGPYVMLAVGDTGVGMDEETRSRIFEPFFTTKAAGQGTGLGLATVFGIVKQSGGHVWAYSEPGHGSVFKVYLPRVLEAAPRVEKPAPGPREWRGSETILVVEDQDSVRRLATRALESFGYRVLQAGNADEALEVCGRHSGVIHLLLTDVVMPGMNGRQLVSRMQALRPEIGVLYMSGYTDSALFANHTLEPGMAYLQKPFTPEGLAGRVREVLGARGPKARLLVVDDDAGVRRVVRRILETGGYSVSEAANGREALESVRKQPVELILTDLVMPEKEGLETIRELRAHHPGILVVAMSGAFDGRFLKVAAMLGAKATIKKPVPPDELLRTIERVLRGS